MSEVVCRSRRQRTPFSEEYLRFTVLTFEKHLGRTVTMEEAKEIAENTLAWLEWIDETSVTAEENSAIIGG